MPITTLRRERIPLKEPHPDAPKNGDESIVENVPVIIDPVKSQGEWFWVSSNGIKGFVHRDDVVQKSLPVEELDELLFAQFCLEAAAEDGSNGGSLIAIAWALSGPSDWQNGKILSTVDEASGRIGPFRYAQDEWNGLVDRFTSNAIGPAQINQPDQQCVIASMESKRNIDQLVTFLNRTVTTRDMFLAHILGALDAKHIQETNQNASVAAILLPIFGNDDARLQTFLNANAGLALAAGKPVPVKDFITNCDAKLQAGLDRAAKLASRLTPVVAQSIPKKPTVDPTPVVPMGPFNGQTVVVTDIDLDALARVAQSEVGHFGKHGPDQLEGGLTAVVDTIISRSVHKNFPSKIADVINAKAQFSAIKTGETWRNLPPASAEIMQIVESHISSRSQGKNSEIGGATHFLNPFFSSANAMRDWGQHVVNNFIKRYGNESKEDVHFHGFAPRVSPPPAYALQFKNNIHHFNGDGTSRPIGTEDAEIPSVIASAMREWQFWGQSTWNLPSGTKFVGHKDNEHRFARYVRDQYCAVGGGTPSILSIQDDQYFWSAVAISFMMKNAGLKKTQFSFAQNHSVYIRESIQAARNKDKAIAYWGFRIDHPLAIPGPGDVIGYARVSNLNREKSLAFFDKTGAYDSHTDIVVAKRPGEIDVIGGNVSDSVTKKTLRLDANGMIVDQLHHWFVVMKRQSVLA